MESERQRRIQINKNSEFPTKKTKRDELPKIFSKAWERIQEVSDATDLGPSTVATYTDGVWEQGWVGTAGHTPSRLCGA